MSGTNSKKWLAGLAAALLITLLPAGAVLATNGMQLIGNGTIARSMGGATVGLPLDASVTVTNPAGMSQLTRRLDVGVTYFDPDTHYSAVDVTPFFGAGAIDNLNTQSSASWLPYGGVVYPLENQKWALGLGIYGTFGMGVDYTTSLYSNRVYTQFAMLKIAPAVSYQINDQFSLGLALNIAYAMMEFNAGRSQTTGAVVPHDEETQIGWGFTLGAMWKINDTVSLGFSYISKQWFDDFEFDTALGKDSLDFDLPQIISFGVGIKPHPRWRIAVDIKWINWSDTMGANQPEWSENSSGSGAWNMDWSDQWVFALGAEFDLTKTVTLRAGYNYGSHPLNSSQAFENIAFPALVEHHFTGGVGWWITEAVQLNFGLMWAPEVTLSGSNPAQGIASYETDLTEYSLEFGLSWKF